MNRDASPSTTSGEPDVEMLPIFTSPNFAEIEIITDIFEEEDIAYMVRKRQMQDFPTTVGNQDQIRVVVEESRVQEAQEFIQQALVDEAIPGDGRFIEGADKARLDKARKKLEKQAERHRKEAEKATKRAEKEAKRAEKEAKRDQKEAERQKKRAERERKNAARKEKKARRLEEQAAKLEQRARTDEERAQTKRDKVQKKRDKADKARD